MKPTVDYNLNTFVLIDSSKTEFTIDYFEASKLHYHKTANLTTAAISAIEDIEAEEAISNYIK